MKMGFSYQESRHLTFGRWADLFNTYKKIHNIIVTQSIFTMPREVEKTYFPDGVDEIVE